MQSNPNTTTKMNNWERVKFLDVCDIQGGTQPPKKEWSSEKKDGYIRMLQIRDFTQDKEKYIEYVKDKSTLKKCRKDDILIGRYGASVGKILIGLEGAYNVAIVKTIPNENILDKNYLYYFLIAPTFQGYIKNAGTRAAQSGFNKSDLENLFLPLPPLSVQKEIVERLDKADAIRQKAQEVVAEYDHLAQALFIDLFGDPVTNEKGWEKVNFEEILSLKRGYDLPVQNRHKEGKIPVYGSNGILDYHNEHKVIKPCLITGRSGTIGIVSRCNQPCWPLNTTLYSYETNGNNIIFLEYLLRYFRLERFLHGAGVPTLDRKLVHKESLPNIPIALQNQFATIIENIEAQKAKAKEEARLGEELFQSLLQKAFEV